MGSFRGILALLAVLVSVPSAGAKTEPCTDTSGFAAAMEAVAAAVPCERAKSPKQYRKKARKALRHRLRGPCKEAFIRRYIKQSLCGRKPGAFEVCCERDAGRHRSRITKAGRCKTEELCDTAPRSVGEGCAPDGTCITRTTLPPTTPPSPPSPTTTLPPDPRRCGDGAINRAGEECDGADLGGRTCECSGGTLRCTSECTIDFGDCPGVSRFLLDFTNGTSGGVCGEIRNASGAFIRALSCGGLNLGGGGALVDEGPTPDGSISRYDVVCTCASCTLRSTSAMPPANAADPDCTDARCNFGTPLPIPNKALPTITTCALNTFATPSSGTLDLATGTASLDVNLTSDVYLTGNLDQPCPRCSAAGSPSSPGTGTCDRGPNAGGACTTTSDTGLTRDCPTGGADPPAYPCTPGGGNCIDGSHIGPINVNLSPLATGTVTSPANDDGRFCPSQKNPGCFRSGACRAITENGVPAGPLTPGTPTSVTLASVFCIPTTGNGIVDGSADLPGPGAMSLRGTFTLTPAP